MSLPIDVRRRLCHVLLFYFFFTNTIVVFLTGCSSRPAAKLACPKFASQTRIVQIWQCVRLHDRSPTVFHWPINEFLLFFSFFLSFFFFIIPSMIFISHCHLHGYNSETSTVKNTKRNKKLRKSVTE
jgi:hypothetical protein